MGHLTFLYMGELPHRAIAVYMYLYNRANKDMQCWPAIPTIAYELKLSVSTVKRAFGDLSKFGYIKKESRYRKSKKTMSRRGTSLPICWSLVRVMMNPQVNFSL